MPGVSPASSRASRTMAEMIAMKPAQSRSISAKSSPRIASVMPSVACGSVGTGTESVPSPRSPAIATRTCHAPAVIIQRWPTNRRGSSADRAAMSGTGANCAPSPESGSGTMRTSFTSDEVVRISTSATPGTAYGGRTVTSTR